MTKMRNKLVDIETLRVNAEADNPLFTKMLAVLTGRIVSVVRGVAIVDFFCCGSPLPAKTIVDLSEFDIDRSVVLCFEDFDRQQPIILGFIKENAACLESQYRPELKKEQIKNILVDGERLLINAEQEVVIQCGQASLTMTKDGKVVIKGESIISRSKGIHKIKAAAVSIN